MSDLVEVRSRYPAGIASKSIPVGYKQTEAGDIPSDWECYNFGDLVDYKKGYAFKSEQYAETGTRIIRVSDTSYADIKDVSPIFISDKLAKLYKAWSLRESDLIFSTVGSKPPMYDSLVGKAIYVTKKHVGSLLNQNAVRIRAKSKTEGIQALLLNHFRTERYIDFIEVIYRGNANQASITLENLFEFKIPLPSSEKEQTTIANALSDVDALISELEKLIAKKQAIKTATMQQLLTGRTRLPQFALREDGTPKGTKPSELGEIPEDWEVMRLGHLAKFFKGSGLPKSEMSESGKIKCIHYGQLFTTYGPKIDRVISRTKNVGIVTSQENDVLMPTSDVTPNGLATASCITETGVTLGGDILIIRSDKQKLNGVFFSYLVNVLRDQVMQLVTGSTVYHLYGSDMAKFEFAFPSKEEQTAIAIILSDMDAEIQALEQRLGKTRQIKQGMMQELLTGKTRLPFNKD